ncbi:putative fatty acyl-CoA reductase CG5065 isoform X2 [Nasonia vitripennis]|uniref:Fatty acyl-CoA reductase n=1 Tax=Nasonia vitripennis TaxID=7425 RepID=A0A7M7Q738_NASVI|nr:putative fatty acyl-CoA reductase CG5065 isoform X2 [Nasonia vitripennis]
MPMFSRIRESKPDVVNKVIAIPGDITLPNLGLSDENKKILEKLNVVFHCAATLRLESNLKDAVLMNTVGTKTVLDMAKTLRNLVAFIHLSTAFCHVDQEELCEHVYESPYNPHDVIKLVNWLDEKSLKLITSKIIEPHPNTYTFSKRLAETLVDEAFLNLPCAIARPSIVTPSWSEPLPGWVDNLNGPVGLIVGAGKGVIRSMHCNANFHAEVIPVDLAINALISIAYKVGTTIEKTKKIPVFNITQSGVMPITWGEVLEKGKSVAYDYPFEGAIWYPDGDIRSSKFVHNLFVLFFHIIPAYFIDFLMVIFHQKRFMVRLQKRISDGLEVLQYFTTREWIFHNTNLLTLWNEMSKKDRLIFSIDFFNINEMEYIKNIILGARQYCMKEKLSSLERARRHQKMLYIVHCIAIYTFYLFMLHLLISNFQGASYMLHYAAEIRHFFTFVEK